MNDVSVARLTSFKAAEINRISSNDNKVMFQTSFSTAFDFSVFSFNKRKISHVRHMAFRWLTWENMNSYKIAHYNIKSTGQIFSVWCYSFLFPSTVMQLIQTVTYFLWKIMSGQLWCTFNKIPLKNSLSVWGPQQSECFIKNS